MPNSSTVILLDSMQKKHLLFYLNLLIWQ